jgi:hypothetical protein
LPMLQMRKFKDEKRNSKNFWCIQERYTQ